MADIKYYDVILKPVITEKSMNAMGEKKYTFLVHPEANKSQIKEAVEKMFEGTKVKSVNTMNMDGKKKRRGAVVGKTAKTKKAIVALTEESKDIIQENNRVSMNMWAGYPCFIDYLENGFKEFLLDDSGDELTKEYLLPIIVDQLIKTNRASVKVLETTDKWFGVTYPEDKQIVQDSIHELIEQGIYPEKLWK